MKPSLRNDVVYYTSADERASAIVRTDRQIIFPEDTEVIKFSKKFADPIPC